MKITNKFLSLILTICFIVPAVISVSVDAQDQYQDGIVWDFNSTDAIAAANSSVATATCGTITADTSFINSYSVSASFTTNSTRRMQIKLPNNVIQQKNSDGDYIYNYLHILVGNPQNQAVTFGCGINTTSENTQVTLPANSWTVASFFIEDLFLAGNSNYKRDGKNYGESVQGVAFQMSDQVAGANTTNAGIKYNLDKIWVTSQPLPEFTLKSVCPSDNYKSMSPLGTGFEFEFGRELRPMSPCVLPDSLTDENGDTLDTTLTVNGNKATITVNEIIKPGMNYTFSSGSTVIKDIYGISYSQELSYNFKTDSSQVLVSDITYTVGSSGEVILSADAINYSDSAASAMIVANITDKSTGTSQLYCAQKSELPANMSSAEVLPSLALSVPSESYLTAVVIDSTDNCKPLSTSYLVLDQEHLSGSVYTDGENSGNVSISLNEPVLLLDTLTISGQISDDLNGLVNIIVREKSSGILKLVMPVSASDGNFTIDYVFDGSGSGIYEISAISRDSSEAAKCEVTYLGANTKEAIRASFDNNASPAISPESALTLLQTYRDGMGIPSAYTNEILAHIANTLCEQKPYATYADLITMLDASVKALDDVNNASWSSYKTVFDKYQFILNNDACLNSYNEYNDNVKAEIHKIVVNSAPFSDFVSLRLAVSNATETYRKKIYQQQQSQNNKNNSGSSFGGGSVSIGGGSSSNELKEQANKPVADTPSGRAEFTDVSDTHWAYPAVNELASRNIISGYEDGSFAGDRAVSRAEFVKIITGYFTFSESKGEKFSDVSDDAWYAPYLERASSAGIVKGTEGLFMPDTPISRQDAAVMLYRCMAYKNVLLDGNISFSDYESVSDYAADAVGALGNAGLISGYVDGRFAPHNEITRFETAQLIYNIINFFTWGENK